MIRVLIIIPKIQNKRALTEDKNFIELSPIIILEYCFSVLTYIIPKINKIVIRSTEENDAPSNKPINKPEVVNIASMIFDKSEVLELLFVAIIIFQ